MEKQYSQDPHPHFSNTQTEECCNHTGLLLKELRCLRARGLPKSKGPAQGKRCIRKPGFENQQGFCSGELETYRKQNLMLKESHAKSQALSPST